MTDKNTFDCGSLRCEVTTIHEAMSDAVHQADTTRARVPYAFRCGPDRIHLASRICERNSTTLPEFLRQCVYALGRDYGCEDHK